MSETASTPKDEQRLSKQDITLTLIGILCDTAQRVAVSRGHVDPSLVKVVEKSHQFDHAVNATIASANTLIRALGGLPMQFIDPDSGEESKRVAIGIHGYQSDKDMWIIPAVSPNALQTTLGLEFLGVATPKLRGYFGTGSVGQIS